MTTLLRDNLGQPLTIRRGTSPMFVFAVKNPDGSAKNLTGATEVTFALATSRRAAVRDLMVTLGSGASHDGVGGNVFVSLTTAQTEALDEGERWCEVWITDNAGRRDLVGEGWCLVHDTLVTVP